METDEEDIYLQKLEELVYDEDKIVTVKLLCRTFNIAASQSRCLLEKYFNDHKASSRPQLSVTYILSGVLKDSGQWSILLVTDKDLQGKQRLFRNDYNKFINSIKKDALVNINVLNLVDYFDVDNPDRPPITGSICTENCTKRIFKQTTTVDKKPTQVLENNSNKTETKTDSKTIKVKAEKLKSNGSGIAGFFSKVDDKKEPKNTLKSYSNSSQQQKDDVKTESLIEKNDATVVSNVPNTVSSKAIKKPSNKKKNSTKKRKRIVQQNDSDSDDIFGPSSEDEENQVVESLGEEEPAEVKPPRDLAPLNKRKKFKDVTYMDEDGYMLTKKELVEASGSEDEKEIISTEIKEPVVVEKAIPKDEIKPKTETSEKISNSKAKGLKGKKPLENQRSLMDFFKKK